MAEISDRLPGEIIFASYSNQIRDRALMRYNDNTARDVSNPVPAAGDLAYILTSGELQIFDGVGWTVYAEKTQVDVFDNMVFSAFDPNVETYPDTSQQTLAALTLPAGAAEYLIEFDAYYEQVAEEDAPAFRLTAQLLVGGLAQETWEFGVASSDSTTDVVSWNSMRIAYPMAVAGGELVEIRCNKASVSMVVESTNHFLRARQVPTGTIV